MALRAWLAQAYETTADADCPQQEEFEIVRCVGHQHIGSRCITLFNAETNEKICQSCPVYGNVTGAWSGPANMPRVCRSKLTPSLTAAATVDAVCAALLQQVQACVGSWQRNA